MRCLTLALLATGLLPGLSAGAEWSEEELRMMALNLYHEGRSEGRDGMIAVGWVVLNRIADEEYPNDVVAVITQKRGKYCEWGWWCDGKSDEPTEADKWQEALDIANELAADDRPADPTDGALWFQETFRERPKWMGDHVRLSATLGHHNFYAKN